jgi:LacI family transcriptional regulator
VQTLVGDSTKRPGIKEIADSLGISTGTVSRSLNNRYGVNPKTRKAVLDEARRIGYVPNEAARALKEHPSLQVGLFFSPFVGLQGDVNPAALKLIDLFRNALAAAGMALRVVVPNEPQQVKLEATAFDVCVVYGHFENNILAAISASQTPAIILQQNSNFAQMVSLLVDTQSAGASAVEYLAALGHERIGLVLSPVTEAHSSGMLEGYRRAIKEFGLCKREDFICEMPADLSDKEGGRLGMTRLLGLADRPTAAIFASDWMAMGAFRAVEDAKLRIPKDISIIGFDNLELSSETSPPLTTFDVHLEKEVSVMVDLVEKLGRREWDSSGNGQREVLLKPDLIRRGSCACLRKMAASPHG